MYLLCSMHFYVFIDKLKKQTNKKNLWNLYHERFHLVKITYNRNQCISQIIIHYFQNMMTWYIQILNRTLLLKLLYKTNTQQPIFPFMASLLILFLHVKSQRKLRHFNWSIWLKFSMFCSFIEYLLFWESQLWWSTESVLITGDMAVLAVIYVVCCFIFNFHSPTNKLTFWRDVSCNF